jgi:hypothetical protein
LPGGFKKHFCFLAFKKRYNFKKNSSIFFFFLKKYWAVFYLNLNFLKAKK